MHMQKINNNFLAINIFGLKKYSNIKSIAKLLSLQDASLIKSNVTLVGDVINFSILIKGHWGAIAKIESALPALEKKLKIRIDSQRTDISKNSQKNGLKYVVHVVGINKPATFECVSTFLDQDFIQVDELKSFSKDKIISYEILIQLDEQVSLAKFRDQVMEYFDEHNLDVIIETKL